MSSHYSAPSHQCLISVTGITFCPLVQMERHVPPSSHAVYIPIVHSNWLYCLQFFVPSLLLLLCPLVRHSIFIAWNFSIISWPVFVGVFVLFFVLFLLSFLCSSGLASTYSQRNLSKTSVWPGPFTVSNPSSFPFTHKTNFQRVFKVFYDVAHNSPSTFIFFYSLPWNRSCNHAKMSIESSIYHVISCLLTFVYAMLSAWHFICRVLFCCFTNLCSSLIVQLRPHLL